MMSKDKPDKTPEGGNKPIIIRNTTDLQRIKLEKLMQNPNKPIIIPEKPKGRGMPVVPDFVRNVMGSSAGAGSGEFHVYRHLRRKEYARQKYLKEKGERERLDTEYREKLDDFKKLSAEKTAKKRQKRLKRKNRQNQKKRLKIEDKSAHSDTSSDSDSDSENTDKKTVDDENIPQDELTQVATNKAQNSGGEESNE